MIEYTDNFNLIKPGQDEFYNVEIFNNNADIIDAELKNLKNTIENLNADDITLPDGKTISEEINYILTELNNAIDDLVARLKRLEDAVMSNITGNPFEISLKDLDGLIVTGIWNKEKQRLEV